MSHIIVECEGPSLRGVPRFVVLFSHILCRFFMNESHEECADEILENPVVDYTIQAFDFLVKPLTC